MFISSLCKRRDGAWRLKPDSQEQVKDLEREPVSMAAPTRKQSHGGKVLSLFASLLFFMTAASNAANVKSWERRVQPEVHLLLALLG